MPWLEIKAVSGTVLRRLDKVVLRPVAILRTGQRGVALAVNFDALAVGGDVRQRQHRFVRAPALAGDLAGI